MAPAYKDFSIEITRTTVSSKVITVNAKTPQDAVAKAMALADSVDFKSGCTKSEQSLSVKNI